MIMKSNQEDYNNMFDCFENLLEAKFNNFQKKLKEDIQTLLRQEIYNLNANAASKQYVHNVALITIGVCIMMMLLI